MVFRYLLKGSVFFFCLLLSFNSLSGQEIKKITTVNLQEYFKKKYSENDNISLANEGTISSLANSYCSDEPYVDIVPDFWHPSTTTIQWNIITNFGATEYHPGWADIIDTGQSTILRFYPNRVVAPYFGLEIYFEYIQRNSIGLQTAYNYDYTFVYKTPTIYSFGPITEACFTGPINLTLAQSETGIQYQLQRGGSPVGFFINGTGGAINFIADQPGTYTVFARNLNNNACNKLMNGSVIVHPLPVVTISSNTPLCVGQTLNLTSSGGTGYSWTGPNSYTSLIQNPSRANVTTSMAGLYTVLVTDANTCQNSAQTNVVINPRPTAVVSGSTTICNGDVTTVSVALTGTPPWSLTRFDGTTSTAVTNILTSPYTFNVSPTASTTYTVTVLSDNNLCGAIGGDITGSAVINVNPRPTSVLSGGGVTTCNGTPVNLSVTLTGTGPWNITYTDGAGTFSSVANTSPHTLPVSPSSTSTYSITALSGATGCVAQAGEMTGTALVTVNPRPTSTISMAGPTVLCNGGSTTISFAFTGTAPWNFTYTANGGSPVSVSTSSNPYTVVVNPAISTTYAVSALSDALCTAIAPDYAGSVAVTVNARPTGVMSGTTTICNGETTQISIALTGASPWNIGYSVNGVPVSISGNTANPLLINVSPSVSTTYLLTSLVDANGCAAVPLTDLSGGATVTVNSRPTAVIAGGGTVCNGGNVALNISLTGSGNWNIYLAANGIPLPVINTSSGSYNLNVSPSSTTTYTVIGLTDGNCTALPIDLSGSATVTVNPRPTAVFGSSTTICNGGNTNLSIALTGTSPWTVNYTFNGTPSNTVIVGPSPGILNVSPSVTTTYVITSVIDANGCSTTPSDISGVPVVTVNPRPTSVISGTTTVCDGTPANLSVALVGLAPWNFTYSDGTNSWNVTTNTSPYIIPVTPSSTRTYTVTALTDATGCAAWVTDMTGAAVITVNTRPTGAVSISGSDEFCNGGSTNVRFDLTGSGLYNMTYTINGIGTTVNGITSPYILPQTPTVTSVYQITALSDANCSANAADISGTATITVYPRPTSVISGSATICNGDITPIRINLTGASPWNIEYTVNGVTVVVNNILNSPYIFSVNPSVNTTYIVTNISDANGCNANAGDMPGSAIVTVNARPSGSLAGGGTVCQGSSTNLTFTLSGAAPFTVNYTVNGIPQSIGGIMLSPYVLPVSPTVNTAYVFTGLSDANCVAQAIDISGSVNVNVDLRPTGVISGSRNICVGESANISVALTGTSPWSVTYSDGINPNVTIPNILVSPYIFSVNPGITTTYTLVSVSDGNSCTSQPVDLTGSATISVNPLPTANISGGGTICNGSSIALTVTFTGTSPWNFSYFDGTTTNTATALSSPYTLNVSPSLTSTYTITAVEDANSCNAAIPAGLTGSASVNVNPRPTAVLSGNQNICLGGTANLTVVLTGTAPWSIIYSDGTTTNTISAGSSPFTLPVSPSVTSTFVITGLSDATTCVSAPADISGSATVTVNQVAVNFVVLPPASAINTRVCSGNTLTYEATPSLGSGTYSYVYELRLLPAGAWNVVGSNINTYTTSPILAAGNYEIRVTVTDDITTCSVISTIAAFEVLALPLVSMTISDNDICLNDAVTFTALPAGYVNYTFNIDGININNGASNVLINSSLAVGLHDVFVTVNNGSCTNSTAPDQVVVRPLPTTALVLDNAARTTVCINEPVGFTASGADEYQFFVNGVAQGIRSATNTFSHFSPNNFNVYVVGYNTFGCMLQSNTINITVSIPVAGLTVNPNRAEHCANETIRFTASGGVSFEFFYNSVSQGVSGINIYDLYPPINGDQIYVEVTNNLGCKATSATRTLIVNPTPVITLTSNATDNTICEGQSIVFTATPNVNFYYRFFIIRAGLDILAQEGGLNTFATSTLLSGDQVYVMVRDENLCNSISPSIAVTVNPNPIVTLTVLPSSHIGEGESVQVVAGGADEYLFLLNGNPVGVWGTSDTWNFATPQNGDIVSVIGRNSFGCEIQHPGITIQVDALPVIYELRAVSDSYCANETGVQLYLTGYELNVDYLLIDIASGSEVPFGLGTLNGGMMTWVNVPVGTYFVRATRTTGIGTTRDFPGTVTVISYPVPNLYNHLPNGTITECYGGISITLDGSETGFNYHLLLNGSMTVQTIIGSGFGIAFDPVYFTGTYTIIAENPVTGCSSVMSGSTFVNAPANSAIHNLYSDPTSGRFCPGSTGVQLWLDNSDLNVAYALYKDNVQVGSTANGTGAPLLVATVTDEGVYMVMVAAQGGCIAPMNGSVTVIADPLPTAFNVQADNNGHYCPGSGSVKIRISGQQMGVVYTLWLGGVALESKAGLVNDPSLALEFDGDYNVDGIYTVTAQLPGGCVGSMTNSLTLVADALPTTFTITGDVGYCTGGSANVYLNGSQSGVEYALFLEGIATGSVLPGNGGILTFTVNQEGEYTIVGTFTATATACAALMTGSVNIVEVPYPEVTVNVITDLNGTDCDNGAPVTILASEAGVVYELLKQEGINRIPTGNIITGNGGDVVFPTLVVDKDATYWVRASRNGCPLDLNTSVYIDVPGAITLFSITGSGDVCIGDAGGTLGLSGSEVGVNYQLYSIGTGPGGTDSAINLPVPGTGFAINFGLIASEGDYYIVGSSVDCSRPMLGAFNLRFNPLPVAFQMTGSGIYCGDVVGASIGLTGSEINVNYKLLWFNGSFNQLMDDINGSGSPLFFNGQFSEGNYTVYARNNLTGCTSSMNGQVAVIKLPEPDATGILPVIDAYTYCSFDGGVDVGLSNSEVGVTYSVVNEVSGVVVSSVTRTETGSFIIGSIPAGSYRIEASRSGECIVQIASGIVISEDPSPVVYTLTGPATGCASSIVLNLSGSETGVVYELYSDAYMMPGNDEGYVAGYDIIGTGNAISFNLTSFVSGVSFFWVKAIYSGGCSSTTDWVMVNVRQAASLFDVELPGGNEYCYGEPGVSVGVSISDVGVGYQLIRGGNTVDFLEGNGTPRMFGLPHGTGTYHIRARHFESGCYYDSESFTVSMNPKPMVFTLSSGGSVNDHEIMLIDGSEPDVQYYLYLDGIEVAQPPLPGNLDSSPISFGTVSVTGLYSVLAVGAGGCTSWMNGSAIIFETPLVAITDTLYLSKGDLIGDMFLGLNDLFLPGVDLPGVNIAFTRTGQPPLGKVTLDVVTGLLVYEKLPSFYGKDSITYVITNTDIPSRISSAKVYIMVGNKDFGDELSFLLPNAFSPNGDGMNDYFVITGLGETEESNLEVFNRWGTIVYRSKGNKYENNWDGRSNTSAMVSIGSELPNGTYYYIFKVKKNVEGKVVTKRYNGYIELRR